MRTRQNHLIDRPRPRHGSLLAAAALLLVVSACTELTTLQQSNPGALDATTVFTPVNANLIVTGAISDFECAFSRYVVGSGELTDELANAISSQSNFDYDRRSLPTNNAYGNATCGANQQAPIYTTLSVARGSADTALAKLKGWTDAQMPTGVNRSRLIGQSAAYAGYSLVLLGEGMCTAAINVGPELQPAQIFAEAKSRFDEAIAAATTASDSTTLRFATLGRARVQLDLGNTAAAATDAATIPASFVVNMATDGVNLRRQNFVVFSLNQSFFVTVDPSFRNLTLNGQPDPRVAVTNANRAGTAPGSQIWTANKYPALTTVMPIARYAEAQLIVAEGKVASGDLAGAAAAINNARNSGRTGMPQYDATGQTAAQVKAQLVEERRRELFLEGHRMGDLRRLAIPFDPPAGTPYPGGGVYGSQSCFPLPDVEKLNNPNIPK